LSWRLLYIGRQSVIIACADVWLGLLDDGFRCMMKM